MRSVSYNDFMETMVMNSKLEPIVNNERQDCTVEEYYDDNNAHVVGKVCHFENGDVTYNVLQGL